MTLTPAQKADLALDLTSHDNVPALNLLITRAVNLDVARYAIVPGHAPSVFRGSSLATVTRYP